MNRILSLLGLAVVSVAFGCGTAVNLSEQPRPLDANAQMALALLGTWRSPSIETDGWGDMQVQFTLGRDGTIVYSLIDNPNDPNGSFTATGKYKIVAATLSSDVMDDAEIVTVEHRRLVLQFKNNKPPVEFVRIR